MNIDLHLEHLESINPDAIRLAEYASLAVRVEPELLREMRLKFLPNSDASAEADLWLSPLVSTRSAKWLAISYDAAEKLRSRLIQRPNELLKVRTFLRQQHTGIASTISLEEEILWLVVSSGARAIKSIDNLLKGVLVKILSNPKETSYLLRWFTGAAERFPNIVKETEGYALLVFVVSALLNGRFIDTPRKDVNAIYKIVAQTLPDTISTTRLWIGFTPTGLRFRHDQAEGYRMIEVPSTNPVLLELRNWDGISRVITVQREKETEVALPRGKVEIVTLTGRVYVLTPVFLGTAFRIPKETVFSPYHFAYDTKINIMGSFNAKTMEAPETDDSSLLDLLHGVGILHTNFTYVADKVEWAR